MIGLQAQLHLKGALLFVEAFHLVKANSSAKMGPKDSWLRSQGFVELFQSLASFCLLQKLVSLATKLQDILLGCLLQLLGLLHAHELLSVLLKHLRTGSCQRFRLDPVEDLRSIAWV